MVNDEEVDEFLEHYGVKGMQWGVRTGGKLGRAHQKHLNNKASRLQKSAADQEALIDHYPNDPGVRYMAKKARSRADRATRRAEGNETGKDKAIRYASNATKVAMGAAFISLAIKAHSETKVSAARPKHVDEAADLLHREYEKQLYSLRRMHQEGKMDADQFKRFSETLGNRYARKIADAGG